MNYVETEFPDMWTIVAFDGGKLGGAGYEQWGIDNNNPFNIVPMSTGNPMYYVNEDTSINDILVVAADPVLPPQNEDPTCDIDGWRCSCDEKPPIDPFSRKPTYQNDYYTWWYRNTTDFNDLKVSYGYNLEEHSWTPLPDGYWGHWIFLDQWAIFGYEDWQPWKFGIAIRDE